MSGLVWLVAWGSRSSAQRYNKRLQRTRRDRASLLSCMGEPLKRSVRRLPSVRVRRACSD
jgi:hypothetical protein